MNWFPPDQFPVSTEVAEMCKLYTCLQSGMRDADSPVVKIGQISAPILKAMVQFMYGRLVEVPDSMSLLLMVAADAHQVCYRLHVGPKLVLP